MTKISDSFLSIIANLGELVLVSFVKVVCHAENDYINKRKMKEKEKEYDSYLYHMIMIKSYGLIYSESRFQPKCHLFTYLFLFLYFANLCVI